MDSEISSNQIKKAFLKIKTDMADLYSRIEYLEKENKILKTKIEKQTILQTKSNLTTKYKLIGNVLSGKVHLDTCPYAKKIALQNLEEFEDIKHALRLKYKKCSCISTQLK
jgi:hypothetical protein